LLTASTDTLRATPLAADAAWDATPDTLRMPMKILKDAGVFPPEVEMFRERARLKAVLDSPIDTVERERLHAQLLDLEQKITLRLESPRLHRL
jgi:hypothetical protein